MGAARLQALQAPLRSLPLKRNDAAWLAYVALNPGAPSSRVATLVWPQASERGALNSLRQRVFRLRQATGARLVEMAQTLTLAPDLAVQEARPAAALAHDPTAWDAKLLAGFDFDAEAEFSAWLAATRKADAERRRDALAGWAAAAEGAGEVARALRYAQRLLAEDALSEHAHRRLMRLHYLRGDRAAALAAFEHCERVLKDELGVRPSAETLRLLQTVEQAVATPAARPGVAPASLGRPPVLVGRQAARDALAQAEQAAQVAVLVGEAGMGKTRLLQECLAGRQDALHVHARPGDSASPYATLQRMVALMTARAAGPAPATQGLEAMLSSAGRSAAAPTTPQALQRALQICLDHAAQDGLRLLALDDLHFADRASVEVLLAVASHETPSSLRWLLAHRPLDAAQADAALLRAFASSPQARWVALQALNAEQLQALVDSLDVPEFDARALAAPLAQHTGGNPLFAVETLRALWAAGQGAGAALPRLPGLAHLIDERLRRLSKDALALARVAAVAVPDFSIELAAHVLGVPALQLADAWLELEAAHVLRCEAFAHDLVYDAMKRATPGPVAAHTHRLVAAFLAARQAEPARVAQHWLAGGQWREAAQALTASAQRACASACFREQTALLDQAAAAFAQAGEPQAALQARQAAAAATLNGDGVDAALARAHTLLAQAPGPLARACALNLQANALLHAGRSAEAEVAARQALAVAPAVATAQRAEAAFQVGYALALRGLPLDGLQVLEPWLNRVDDISDLRLRYQCWAVVSNLLAQADRGAEALMAAQKALRLAEQ